MTKTELLRSLLVERHLPLPPEQGARAWTPRPWTLAEQAVHRMILTEVVDEVWSLERLRPAPLPHGDGPRDHL